MNTKIFNTRLQMKYDTWNTWSDPTKQFTLLKGEIAIVDVPANQDADQGIINEPAILFKVGDGESTFNQLPFVSALAGDVPAWAKVAEDNNGNKLSDKAFVNALEEIESIKAFLSEGDSPDTTTIIDRVKALESSMSNLEQKVDNQETFITETINTNLTDYENRLKEIENDYLTSSDLEGIGQSVESLITNYEATKARVDTFLDTEGVADTVDTLHDIKTWMEGDGVNATELTQAIAKETSDRETAILAEKKAREDAFDAFGQALEGQLNNLKTTTLEEAASAADTKIENFGNTLAPVATSGILEDLDQENEYVIFNCGSATTLISEPIKNQ